ncbi:MAG: Ig-like domain-containing protein [Pyrinomonadaceae bacterium]
MRSSRFTSFSLFATALIIFSFLSIGKNNFFPEGDADSPSNFLQAEGEKVSAEAQKQKIAEEYGRLPLHFEPNLGQTDREVKFLARGQGYGLFLTENEAVLTLEKSDPDKNAVVRMRFDGALAGTRARGLDETAGRTNYFIGNDPEKWKTDVPNYKRVRFESVYEGIDLVYYGNNQRLEYDFVVAPNADPNQIRLNFSGIENARVEPGSGDLLLETGGETIRQHKPFVYQEIGGERKEVAGLYRVKKTTDKEFSVRFALAGYDKSQELIIDPILVYGSYLGGSLFDEGSGIAVDSGGNAYVVGTAASRDFPTTAGTVKPGMLPRIGSTSSFWYDAFVTKINPDGTALVFSTYFGGRDGNESGGDIEVDDQGNIYFTGTTMASDFPTVNAYQTSFGGTDDAFLAKLNPTGSAIIYSTYLGGNNTDLGRKIALDRATGEATVIGRASSPNFPTTPGALKEKLCDSPTTCSGVFFSGSYIARFADDGTIAYATLFSAGLADVAIDVNNNAVIAGTGSSSLTTPGAFQTISTGGIEGYLGKLNPAGNQIVFGTLLGGGLESDVISGVAVDAAGNMYVAGTTENAGFPTTPGAFDTTFNGTTGNNHDGFLTKFDPTGSSLVYSTFLGGTGKDEPKEIGLGSDDSAFIIGETTGAASFPLKNSLLNSGNIFLTHFNADASALVYSTILGQGGGYDLTVDSADNAFITGRTNNIPVTPGTFQPIIGGGLITSPDDGFVLKIGPTDETVTHYAISGSVTNENTGFTNNYSPIVVTVTGTVNRSINISYDGGQYYFGNLPAGGNYTVTAKKAGYETSPQSIIFNNLGANQFGDFVILRNHEPEATITNPAHGDTFQAPASITIQADAGDPDDGDSIQKVEFVAYGSSVGNVPIGVDTQAPFEITWNDVPSGTWALYAYPYDNHGLRGNTMNVVHVFVTEPGGPTVTLTSPTEGQSFQAGEYITFSVDVSPSVTRVEYYKDDALLAISTQSPFTKQVRFTETGDHAITAKAYNSQSQSTTSNVANISIVPFNHTISGRILDSLNHLPVEGVTVNLTSSTNPAISGTTLTDSGGNYSFTDIFGQWDDGATVTPVQQGYTFNPPSRTVTIGFSDHLNQNFVAVPVTGITVNMTSPANGQNFPVNPTVTLAADASSTSGAITKVRFYEYMSGSPTLINEDTSAPYSFDWANVAGGNHTIFARAYDDAGGIADSTGVFISVATPPTSIRLMGTVTNANGNWMPGITVRLTGTANGNPVNQTSVSNTFGAYGFFNLPVGGDYTVTPEGASGVTFTPPSFSVTGATADNIDIDFQASNINQPPNVVINSPSDGAIFTLPVTIQMSATATDPDGQVTHFSMTATGNNRSQTIGEVNNGNFDVPWQPSEPGQYTIFAVARDNGGLRTTEQISITINPPAPVSISGRIVNRDSQGIADVTLTLKNLSDGNAADITVQTDSNGNYIIPGVATFNNYRLKASKLNYTLSPQYRNYFSVSTDQTGGDFTGTLSLQPSDFDGDGETDLAVWRPSTGVWHINRSNDGSYTSQQFGSSSFGDVATPGNFDGDDKIDVAVYRQGVWYISRSSSGEVEVVSFGLSTDKPIPGDYDGDGKTDIAVWRPASGVWYIRRSSDGGFDIRQFGQDGDLPLSGDYDGDGKTDLAVWRPDTGVWYVLQSTDGNFRAYQFGAQGDIPLVGDFDGDKLADYAIFRPATGVWYILQSADGNFRILQWGANGDTPVPGDYDRDGKTDLAVFRKSEGNWYVLRSSTGSFTVERFGLDGDVPLPSAYMP